MSAGKVRSVPPPAIELTTPAPKAAATFGPTGSPQPQPTDPPLGIREINVAELTRNGGCGECDGIGLGNAREEALEQAAQRERSSRAEDQTGRDQE